MSKPRITLKDIATKAGVHSSTVSRVINPKTRDMVTKKVADKILSLIKKYNYRPNTFAQSLKTNRSFTIGIIVPDLTNPAFSTIIKGAENMLETHGFSVMISNTYNSSEKQLSTYEKFMDRHVDGLIIASSKIEDPFIKKCKQDEIPFVQAVRASSDKGVSSVVSDEVSGGIMVISHLKTLGHNQIAYISGPQFISTGKERYQGFIQGMKLAEIKINNRLVIFCNSFSEEEGRNAAKKLLATKTNFTAIFTGNDIMALGVYSELKKHRIKCGKDISVVGFDDMPFADKFNPPLTTVHTPLIDVGKEAARLLLDKIENSGIKASKIKLEPDLIIRASTKYKKL